MTNIFKAFIVMETKLGLQRRKLEDHLDGMYMRFFMKAQNTSLHENMAKQVYRYISSITEIVI